MDCIPPGSSLHGIFQAKILEWVAISYSRGSLNPSLLHLLPWAGGFFISVPPGKPFIPLVVPKQIVLRSSSYNSKIQQALKTENVIKSWILKHIQRQSLNWNKNFKNQNEVKVKVAQSLWPLYYPWDSPGQNTGVSSLSLLQGIFLTQESNQGLLHCRQILYQLSYLGIPKKIGYLQERPSTFTIPLPPLWQKLIFYLSNLSLSHLGTKV